MTDTNIKAVHEPSYSISRNGLLPYVEVIFELNNGELYKGSRTIEQTAGTTRRKFRLWLAGKLEDRYAFEQVDSVSFQYK
jgi:hypothetical protein